MDEQDAQEIVAQAIQSARYNEAVIVTVDNPDVGDENNQHNDIATMDDGLCCDYDGNHDAQSNNDDNTNSNNNNNNINHANGQGASSGSSREIVLVACLDTENGGIVWKDAALASSHPTPPSCIATDASDSTEDSKRKSISNMTRQGKEDMGIIRHFRTKRWAIPMLNDRRRNALYESAIRRACESLVQKRRQRRQEQQKYFNDKNVDNDEVIRILDIGSGTGLLAMMGAKYARLTAKNCNDNDDQHHANENSVQQPKEIENNEIKVQVTSVEMASAMARIARQTISENGLSEKITIVESHSTDEGFAIDDARFGRSSKRSIFDASYSKSGASLISHGNMNNHKYADICTSELLESGLIREGVLPAIRDAWKRHLNEDAIVVPRRARVVAVIVEGKNMMDEGLNKGNDSASVNAATCFIGPDLHSFREASGGVWLSVSTSGSSDGETTLHGVNDDVEGVAVPLHADSMLNEYFRDTFSILHDSNYKYDAYKLRTSESDANTTKNLNHFRGIKALTDPTTVLEFDFASGLNSIPFPSGRSIANRIVPTNDGVAHAVLFWWELDLWDGEKENSTYSTAPLKFCNQADTVPDSGSRTDPKDHWQDHWQQVLFVFSDASFSGGENKRILERGSPVELVASHNDTSISFRINEYDSGSTDPRPSQRRKLNSGDQTASVSATVFNRISPTRALQLNDINRIGILRNAILHAIRMKGQNAPILDLSDMGICAMIAAVSGAAKNVTSLESSSGQMPMLAATIMQLGNGLSDLQILQAQAEHISTEHILGGPAEIVVAEPYYEILEGWHLQEALNYFYLVRSLKSKGLVSSSSISVPSQAFVMACVVEFQDFYDSYGKVGNNNGMVAGFRHDVVNFYGARYHTYDVSLPLCQYQYKRLSKTFCIAKINYDGNNPKLVAVDDDGEGWAYTLFERTGTAHAFVCWVDYMCRTDDGRYRHENGNLFDVISTSSSSHNQGVRKLDEAIAITESIVNDGTKFCCFASFGSDPDGIEDHSFAFKMK